MNGESGDDQEDVERIHSYLGHENKTQEKSSLQETWLLSRNKLLSGNLRMHAQDSSKWDLFDVLQGEYLSKVVSFLYKEGIFEELPTQTNAARDDGAEINNVEKDADTIAKEKGFDPEVFHQLLAFVAGTTDLIILDQRTNPPLFRFNNARYDDYGNFGHYIDKVPLLPSTNNILTSYSSLHMPGE